MWEVQLQMNPVLAELTFPVEGNPDGGNAQVVALGGKLVVLLYPGRPRAGVGGGNGVPQMWSQASP